MLLSVFTKKDKVPRLNFHPLSSRPWLRGGVPVQGQLLCLGVEPNLSAPTSAQVQLKRQISADGTLRVRASDPTQLSPLREQGTHEPTGHQAFHLN